MKLIIDCRRSLITLIVGFVLAISSAPYSAAQSPGSGQQSDPIPGAELYNSFQNIQGEVDELQSEAKALSGDSLDALEQRIYVKQVQGIEILNKVLELIQTRQQQQQPVDQTLELVSPTLNQLGSSIIKIITREKQAHQKQSNDSDELSAQGLRQFLEYQNRSSATYKTFTDLSLKIKAIGLDNQRALKFLEEELTNRAEVFIGIIELNDRKQQELKRLLKISPEDESLTLQNNILIERDAIAIDHLRQTIELLSSLGVNTDDYQQQLIAASGQITTDMLDIGLASELLTQWSDSIISYFADNGVEILFKLIIFFAIIFAFRFLSKLVQRVLLKSLDNSNLNLSSLMKEMVTSIASRLVMLLGILIALSQIGISLGPLLAGLGVAGFIIGFALQDTLGNFASGMMILIYRPYDVGDMVEAAGVFGEVKGMSLVSTTILTIDHQTLVIPNNKIWGDVIKNVTAQKVRRVDMVFGIGYSDDIEHAERLFNDILESHPKVLANPKPVVRLHSLGESSVDFVVRPWVKTEDWWEVYWDVTREVKMRMDREGLNIPFPQRDVHLYQVPTAPDPATPAG